MPGVITKLACRGLVSAASMAAKKNTDGEQAGHVRRPACSAISAEAEGANRLPLSVLVEQEPEHVLAAIPMNLTTTIDWKRTADD